MIREPDLETFSHLLSLIYRGPLESAPWQGLLDALRETFASSATILVLRSPSQLDPGLILMSGVDLPDSDNRYSSGYYDLDPFVNLPAGEVVSLDQTVDQAALETSAFYQQCMEPWGIYHVLGVDLRDPGGVNASLRIARPRRTAAFGDADRRTLAMLAPHLQQALALHNRLQRLDTERALLESTVNRQALATLSIDDQRRLLQSNPVAERLLAQRDGIRVVDGAVELARSTEQQHFKALVGAACDALHQGRAAIAQAMSISRSASPHPLNLVLRPMGYDNQGKPLLALFISDPADKAEASQDVLAQLFRFTPAEARLAMLLANGHSLDAATAELGISRNTGRAHLRAIFAKTGVSQQTQLVSLLLKSVARLG
ncbi:MAG TPA: helix-turn-helix transcriptional regulator [Spongiibacteraceae bacterium]|jgi:DNA-binding CsgD family transcriptional regulator|nr:helix-turn-helix transcriptional regulator [Spongiibacteraceae bacterium]HUH36612.1 helix-turn-helix transcriptional regulator [Spongiibacteraceae bacterium]